MHVTDMMLDLDLPNHFSPRTVAKPPEQFDDAGRCKLSHGRDQKDWTDKGIFPFLHTMR